MDESPAVVGNSRRHRIYIAAFIAGFALLHIAIKLKTGSSAESNGADVGQEMASFNAKTLNGDNVELAAIAKTHKLVILNYWESWCAPCRVEMPDLENLYLSYKDQGLEILGVTGQSREESVKQFIREHSLTFTMIHDWDGSIARQLGVSAVPSTYVIGPDLKILRSQHEIDPGFRAFIEKSLGVKDTK